jgi:hypothetical protein
VGICKLKGGICKSPWNGIAPSVPAFFPVKREVFETLKCGGVLTGGNDSLLMLVSINRLISVISQKDTRANRHFGDRPLAIKLVMANA